MSIGITTSTLTNPIWLVKTRMQLQQSSSITLHKPVKYKNSFDCVMKVMREEGISGLYKGLSASYLGVTESTIHWVTYEYLKSKLSERRKKQKTISGESVQPFYLRMFDNLLAAGLSKFVAACISYPHEVIRTRMRQLPTDGAPKYNGIIKCFKTILREEGVSAFYGGMTAHMMRVVPNAAIMFFCYESILHYGESL
ncbi:6084_t:CDS:2 [Scutellospora calospora]|uniref:6084_t:CDS:1 n=1 Tax=Scutellospora calospora TaxID=85575 RepID=A0ACA9JTW9_9GLOM|nr:6084_t:CDS:2 [Scutellospora calospora]